MNTIPLFRLVQLLRCLVIVISPLPRKGRTVSLHAQLCVRGSWYEDVKGAMR